MTSAQERTRQIRQQLQREAGPAKWNREYLDGKINAAEWTFTSLRFIGQSARDCQDFRTFAERARERIPLITFPVKPDVLDHTFEWNSMSDVYAFGDDWSGGIFNFSHFFEAIVQERDVEKRGQMADDVQAVLKSGPGAPKGNVNAAGKAEHNSGNARIESLGKRNDSDYVLARLHRDRPDLEARVLAKELSANAAAIEAGFRERTITVPLNPEKAARILRKYFSADQLAQIARLWGTP